MNAIVNRGPAAQVHGTAVQQAWASYVRIPVRLAQIDVAAALELAISLGLYTYDGYVLDAARGTRAPSLTLDAALARAARSIGLTVMGLPQ